VYKLLKPVTILTFEVCFWYVCKPMHRYESMSGNTSMSFFLTLKKSQNFVRNSEPALTPLSQTAIWNSPGCLSG